MTKSILLLTLVTGLGGCVSSETDYTRRANNVLSNPPRDETETAAQKADREVFGKVFGHETQPLSVNDKLEPAVLLKHVAPKYPATAKSRRLAGQATVAIIVSTEGRVAEAKLLSSTNPVFEAAALDAVRQWTFQPARRNGELIAFSAKIPIVFQP